MKAELENRRKALLAAYPVWTRRTVADHFDQAGEKYGLRTFISTLEREYSYSEALERAGLIARGLTALGVRPGEHVALLMGNYPEFVFAKIAIAKIGAVCVPLNIMLREEELAFELADSDAVVLVAADRSGKSNHMEVLTGICPELFEPAGGDRRKRFARFPLLRDIVCFSPGGRKYRGTVDFNELYKMGQSMPEDALRHVQKATARPDDISDIMYTIGFSDKPKGAMLSHDMMLRGAYATCLARAMEEGRRIFSPLPFYHVFALQQGLLAASFVGGAVIPQIQFSPREALELMEKRGANDVLCVPSMLSALLNYPALKKYDLGSLQAVMCAAAPVSLALWRKLQQELGVTELSTGYGMTEIGGAGVLTSPEDPLEAHASRVGRTLCGGAAGVFEFGGHIVQYQVVDPSTGKELPPGVEGEWYCRGHTVTGGYYKRPQENDALTDKDGWLRTGDLGIIHPDGLFELTGNNKGIYKTSGENVLIKEVENVISTHPGVNRVWVAGVPDQIRGEVGVALIELKEGEEVTALEIVDYCKERMSRFKVPHHVFFVSGLEIPFDSSGGVERRRLVEYAAGLLRQRNEKGVARQCGKG
ncbi:MAG: long-chain fatty acid--CoA ligase [Peptococcaceae bacterium]|nr:MAG: long-chain fatty acid--CoA ligase [Peptococcaceae bacterium]